MYLSQIEATVLYTVFKTILLMLLTQTIYSICAWMNRYDLAKIFEQGSVTIVIGSLTSNKYKKYSGMFICLFVVICFEIVIGFLPTIATKYMPFESVNINNGKLEYFQSNFDTPIQNISTTSNNQIMDEYCFNMNLCDNNKNYFGNILNISNSMNFKQIQFNEKENKFVTEFLNITFDEYILNNETNYNNYIKIYKETNSDFTMFMSSSSFININYDNISSFNGYSYIEILPLMYYTEYFNFASINNKVDILYSDGKNHVILIMKAAMYNNIGNNIPEYNAFNNTNIYHNIVQQYKSSKDKYTKIVSKYTYNDLKLKIIFNIHLMILLI